MKYKARKLTDEEIEILAGHKPIKAKTLVKKIKDMNNKSGDCLDKEFEYYGGLNKRDDKALQDKDKPVEIEKLVINGIPENPEKELNTDSYNDYQISLKINEIISWINDHQRQHDLDD